MSSTANRLHCDARKVTAHEHRYLFDDRKVRYITVPNSIHSPGQDPEILPLLPDGDWKYGVLEKNPQTGTFHIRPDLERPGPRGLQSTLDRESYDHLELELHTRQPEAQHNNVFTLPPSATSSSSKTVAKIARKEDEIGELQKECAFYGRIEHLNIAPKVLAFVTEEERKIGFIMEHIEGVHPRSEDLGLCKITLDVLHNEGVRHGDCHFENIILKDGKAYLIDFGAAESTKADGKDLNFEGDMVTLRNSLIFSPLVD